MWPVGLSRNLQITAERLALDRQNCFLDFFGLIVDCRSALGQRIAALLPIKQTGPQFCFEGGHPSPDGRGTGSELARRVRKTARARHSKEMPEIIPFHGNSKLNDEHSIIAVCRSKFNC